MIRYESGAITPLTGFCPQIIHIQLRIFFEGIKMLRFIYHRLDSIEESPRKASHLDCMNALAVRFYHQVHACTIHSSVMIEFALISRLV